ncbi:MAG: family 43 glycosylhydrolase [Acidobacteria bacterium]|nr:family 43 glycosylhydrolase [Acidobacteriota bacterium]
MLKVGARYALLHTDITWPVHALRVAFADSPYGPWGPSTDAFTLKGSDSPVAVYEGGAWLITFFDDSRTPHLYRTRDFWEYTDFGTVPAPLSGWLAPKPLFRDPVHDGAADPVLVFHRARKQWWMFYTNRRANVPGLPGVAWVHGTRIGIACSGDGGAHWQYRGTAEIPYGTAEYTHWAPDIVDYGGVYHMYLSIVPGIFENWNAAREIIHLTSTDLEKWTFESRLELGSDRVIDPTVARLPDGTWRMWYKNERARDGSLYYADSSDLAHWTSKGNAIPGVAGEGPKVFSWQGSYWLIADVWDGFAVFRSSDCLNWTRQQGNLLKEPGTIETDRYKGNHADVVVNGSRAWLFYFVHQPGDQEQRKHTVLQVVELKYREGLLGADRNQETRVALKL